MTTKHIIRPDAKSLTGNGCILLATIFWGINIPVVKALVPAWMSADAVTDIRIIGACLLFWLCSLFVKTSRIDRADWPRLIAGGAIGLFSFIYLLNLSLKYANPIDVSIIMTLPPVFVILIDVCFRHTRPSLTECLGITAAFAGAVIVITTGHDTGASSNRLLGDIIALASALCYSIYLTVTETPSRKYHPVTMLRWTFLFAAIPAAMLLPSLAHMPVLDTKAATPWAEAAFIMLCPSFLAYFLLSPALKRIGSELVSIYQYLIPVVATVASVAMKLDRLHWQQVVAMAVIIGGMILTTIAKKRRQKRIAETGNQTVGNQTGNQKP